MDHDALASIVAASGRTMAAKAVDTAVTVTVDGNVEYNDAV